MASARLSPAGRATLGRLALVVGALSLVLGYVLVVFGLSLRLGLAPYRPTHAAADVVALVGLALVGAAYACWRGFLASVR